MQEARRKLIDLYHRNGFNNAQVRILEGDKPTDHGIVFVINEGMAQKIWKVEFVGNEFVSDRRLKTQIDSKPPMMMVFKGYVDREQIDADVEQAHRLLPLVRLLPGQDRPPARVRRKEQMADAAVRDPRRPALPGRRNVAFIGNKIFRQRSLALKPDPTARCITAAAAGHSRSSRTR